VVKVMAKGRFEEVPLAELFPDATPDDFDRMRAVAARVDAVRPDAPLWDWRVDHAHRPVGVSGYFGILLTSVVLDSEASDWHELFLEIEWQPNGQRRAWAAVNIACWCETDHGTHYPVEVAEEITGDAALGAALERVVGPFLEWLEDPIDPSVWRERAGLPQRSGTS
jgi:hypothetical protein